MPLKLHSMWRATAPYRVRIGLELKGLAFEYSPLDFAASEQRGPAYSALNPQKLSPTLEADGRLLTQSLAILEWLDETHPAPPLLPTSPDDRAVVRAMAGIVACDIHPLNNLRVLQTLQTMGHPIGSEDQRVWALGGSRTASGRSSRWSSGTAPASPSETRRRWRTASLFPNCGPPAALGWIAPSTRPSPRSTIAPPTILLFRPRTLTASRTPPYVPSAG